MPGIFNLVASMKRLTLNQTLWGEHAKARYLYLAAAILFFSALGARELWTQEHRWADIVAGMFLRQDFFHPYLGNQQYYDKPLLSYWMMAGLSKLFGGISTVALRLPSALAGLLGLWSVVRIGSVVKDRSLGLLAGWLFITTYYLIFWGRVSSADMLNLAGTFFAVAWYLSHRNSTRFLHYAVFFLILALTALCKGLGGAIVPVLMVLVDVALRRQWLTHCRPVLVFAALPALLIYLLPFWLSSHFGGAHYGESGLYMVYRENILRYFKPFDHTGSIATYFIFLPIYLLPWTVLFIPALFALPSRIKHGLSLNQRWLCWSFLVVFLFFTFSGSRRSYYVLPIVPLAILFTADWALAHARPRFQRVLARTVVVMVAVLWLAVDMLPAWHSIHYGMPGFATEVKAAAGGDEAFHAKRTVLIDAESKINFYLELPPTFQDVAVIGGRDKQSTASLLMRYPVLAHLPPNTIFITRASYLPLLLPIFKHYAVVITPTSPLERWFKMSNEGDPIAFIPLTTHHE